MGQLEASKDQEQIEVPGCVLCGTKVGAYKFFHGARDKGLHLCVDCMPNVTKSLTREQLDHMTVAQLKRHMEVRDELAARYRDSFVATKKFCVGKRRTVPILEVDEEHGWWALPKSPMPLALSISSIQDVEVSLTADDLDESGELIDELIEGAQISSWVPYLRTILNWLYKSKHTNLAPIPEGQFVSYLKLVLSLDDRESGLGKVEADLLPFMLSLPSRVNAGYDCAYEVIEYLKQLASDDYKLRKKSRKRLDLTRSDRLFTFAASGLMSDDEAELLRYYLERVPPMENVGATGTAYAFVKSVVDAVSDSLIYGEREPELKTLHTADLDVFLGAFYRYAPGLSLSDVVYIMDDTKIQSGKGGLLFAQDCFAVDDFNQGLGESEELVQPIQYDDLLFVGAGEEDDQLVLAFCDDRRITVNGGRYAHFIFAAVNCILLLLPER